MKVTQTTEAVIYTLNWKMPKDSTPIQFLILQMKKLKPKEAIYLLSNCNEKIREAENCGPRYLINIIVLNVNTY